MLFLIVLVKVAHVFAAGRVTDRLTAAFRDPVVRSAHIWELSVMVVIIVLMIVKPF